MGRANQANEMPEVQQAGAGAGTEAIDGFSAEVAQQLADAMSKNISRPPATQRVGETGGVLEITPAPELQHHGDKAGKDNTDKVQDKKEDVKDNTSVGGQILSAAELSLGEKRWQEAANADATRDGKLGASAAVSAVLRDAGVNVDEISISGLEQALMQKGWQKVPFDQRQAGDVVIARRENSYGNSGIVGEGNSIFTNNSRTGQWMKESAAPWVVDGYNRYSQVYVLRPGQ
jgi:hypothetical protein